MKNALSTALLAAAVSLTGLRAAQVLDRRLAGGRALSIRGRALMAHAFQRLSRHQEGPNPPTPRPRTPDAAHLPRRFRMPDRR